MPKNKFLIHTIYISIAVLQIFSSYLFVPGLESAGGSVFRIFLLFLAAYIFARSGFWQTRDTVVYAMLAMFLLLLWMTISLMWSADPFTGSKQVSYVATMIILSYVVDNILKDSHDFQVFCKYIILVGILVTIASYYEIETGIHYFPSQTFDEAAMDPKRVYLSIDKAWLTFGNPNNLAVHFVFCAILAVFLLRRVSIISIVMISFVSFNVYLMYILDARLAIVALFAYFVTYFLLLLPRRLRVWSLLLAIVVPCGIIALLVSASRLAETFALLDDSTVARIRLLALSVEMAVDSFMVGVGTGEFSRYILDNRLIGQTYGIVDAHNAFARMFAENGIVGLTLLMFIVVGPLLPVAGSRWPSKFGAVILATVVCLPMLLSIHSDPLSSSSLQLFIAMTWVAGRFVEKHTNPAPTHSMRRHLYKPNKA